ncbi:MAG: hypothetical protein NTU44_02070 [Bacteroidetes bacterium]|nr:hypothetical protein [Bacteroidota bacterium]
MTLDIELISSVEEKIIQLLTQKEGDKREIRDLQEKIVELQKIIQEKDLTISKLEQELVNQSFTKSSEKGKENVETKERINQILREIDYCIGMMNS